MKNLILILLTTFTFNTMIISQDIIIYKDGTELESKVLKVGKTEITYKKYSNLSGPEYTEEKNNIFMIKYENGSKDIFKNNTENNNTTQKTENNKQENNCNHKVDSIIFMNNKYMIVCQDCNKKIRYASSEEVQLNGTKNSEGNNTNIQTTPCGEEPKEPINTFNKYQFKSSKIYKSYQKELSVWKNCVGE